MLDYIQILKNERSIALGCTEPGAVAYAASCAAARLKGKPENLEIFVSENVLKNALYVGIPRTKLRGIRIAAALGCLSGNPEKKLESLSQINACDIERAEAFLKENRVQIRTVRGVDKLYIRAVCKSKQECAEVEIQKDHTNITMIKKNESCLYCREGEKKEQEDGEKRNGTEMSLSDIYEFVCRVPEEELCFLEETIAVNKRLSEEGFSKSYGLEIGRELEKMGDTCTAAGTAAAIDARMGGCSLPVVALGGSGNQGLTSSLPVIFYGESCGKSQEEIKRALLLSQLVTLAIKQKTGKLSALCSSALAAGTGAACGITYLQGGERAEIESAVKNMAADLSGMVCDGAKAGCALKIATAVNSACRSAALAMSHISASETDGIVDRQADKTIDNLGRLVGEGMEFTDRTLLKIMTE